MNTANKLTLLRIYLIPFFVFFLVTEIEMGSLEIFTLQMEMNVFIALILFSVASLTDWLDGHLARKNNWITDFGKFMDPLADKILVTAAFICMVELQWIPAWAVIIIITREFAVTGLRLLVSSEGEVIAAKTLGKLKTVTQIITLILYFIIPDSFISLIFLYASVLITLYSGWDYFKSYLPLLNPNK